MLLRIVFGLLFLCGLPLRADEPPPNAKPHYEAKSMSQEEFAKEMAQSSHYTFDLASPDGLVDPQGIHIRAEYVMAYLREKKLDPKAYFLLEITPASPKLDTLAPTVDPIGRFGATKVVVRQKTDGPATPITREFQPVPGTPADDKPKSVFIQGRPNPKSLTPGQAFPDLSGRPAELRPEALPRGVRYAFGPDQMMIEAEALIKGHLLAQDPPATMFFQKNVQVQAGAWKELRALPGLGQKSASPLNGVVAGPPGNGANKQLSLQGMILADPAELTVLEHALAKMISDDGGGRVRAIKNAEMARWWPFISFDLVEPILVVETNRGGHLFVLSFADGRPVAFDDLKGLPPASAILPKAP